MIKSQVVLKALKYMFWSIVRPLVHQFFFPTCRKQASPASGHVPLVSRVLFMGSSTVQDLICISAGKYMYFE